MIALKNLAIIFFDLIDKYFHQKRIITFLKTHFKEINIFLDIGSHKGTYTDLILKNILVTEKLILIEPQKNIFDFIQNKYKNDRSINIYNHAISNKEKKMKLHINKHDLTSSLTEIDKNNKYLNLKAKLFGGSLDEMIKKKITIKALSLKNIINKEDRILKTKFLFQL